MEESGLLIRFLRVEQHIAGKNLADSAQTCTAELTRQVVNCRLMTALVPLWPVRLYPKPREPYLSRNVCSKILALRRWLVQGLPVPDRYRYAGTRLCPDTAARYAVGVLRRADFPVAEWPWHHPVPGIAQSRWTSNHNCSPLLYVVGNGYSLSRRVPNHSSRGMSGHAVHMPRCRYHQC